MNIDALLPSMLLVLLKAQTLSSNNAPANQELHHMHAKFICKAFSKLLKLFYIRSMREGDTVCDVYPDALFKAKERWIGWMWYGALCNHWVMEPERDKDVPNKHNPHALSRSTALHHRTCMCVFACAFEKGGRVMRGETKRALVFWVCLASALSQRLWFQSVTVSRDCGSVSAAPLLLPSCFCLSFLSWVQLNTCSLQ